MMASSRSVLIVEDEPLIAMLLEDVLESLGYVVAGNADSVPAALARVEDGGFDVVILDVHLRDGEPSWAVADALSDRGIPFVFATGGHVEPPPERHRNAAILTKPYTMDGVEQAIDALS